MTTRPSPVREHPDSLRLPPQAAEAEQSVLGSLLLDNAQVEAVLAAMRPEDFYHRNHQVIFRAICDLCDRNQPADVITVSEQLQKQGELDNVGGLAYLGSLASGTPSTANAGAYARIVHERSILRRLITASNETIGRAYAPEGRSPGEILDLAEQSIYEIAEGSARRGGAFEEIKNLSEQAIEKVEKLKGSKNMITGLATGFDDLDAMTSGLQSGDLVIIAGRPSMGKCLVHDSELVMDDGGVISIEEVFRKRRGERVGTLTKDFRLARSTPSDYVDDGIKPVFEVTTRSGRRIETTLTHPFLTVQGWRALQDLTEGDAIAVPRRLPVFGQERLRECEIKLLAYLIGDGGLTGNTARFTNSNARIVADFQEAVRAFGGLSVTLAERRAGYAPSWSVAGDRPSIAAQRAEFAARLDRRLASRGASARAVAAAVGVSPAALTYWRQGKSVPNEKSFSRLCEVLCVAPTELAPGGWRAARKNSVNPLARWLEMHGLMGHGASKKEVPPAVFRLAREQQALFLNRLFATDGWVTILKSGQVQLGYATINERLARQIKHLLLRFGVLSSLRQRWVSYRATRRPAWQLDITHAESILEFARDIGVYGKEQALAKAVESVARRRRQTNTDLLPVEIWSLIARAKGDLSWSALARKAGVSDSNVHAGRRGLSRPRLAKFAMALGDRELLALAHSDVYWDRIVSIVPAGGKQVYDLTIPETHNFIANDVCVHNTSLAMNIVEHVAIGQGKTVAVFSMEMPSSQLALRMLGSLSRVNGQRLRSGTVTDEDWSRLLSAHSMLHGQRIFIDDTPALSPLEIRTRARRLAREAQHIHDPEEREAKRLALIVVDYLQLMQSTEQTENRATEIANITRSLKILAKELDVPLVALSQLNRSVESRPNKRPVMSDLRESGAVEQDADVILFIYRDEVYEKESKDKGTAEIIIGKQRNGPIGTIRLTYLGHCTRFENYASPEFVARYRGASGSAPPGRDTGAPG